MHLNTPIQAQVLFIDLFNHKTFDLKRYRTPEKCKYYKKKTLERNSSLSWTKSANVNVKC